MNTKHMLHQPGTANTVGHNQGFAVGSMPFPFASTQSPSDRGGDTAENFAHTFTRADKATADAAARLNRRLLTSE
ncbi:MAG: hypothetical protein V4526_00110 [Patescibacteria group bacterium]